MELFTKYLYIIVILVLIIVLIIFFRELLKLMKRLSQINTRNITNNIEITKDKLNKLKKDEESIKTAGAIFLVVSILKETLNDYKKSTKKKMLKSLTKTCIKNATKLSKIKIK